MTTHHSQFRFVRQRGEPDVLQHREVQYREDTDTVTFIEGEWADVPIVIAECDKRECERCGLEFYVNTSAKKYCSPYCQMRAKVTRAYQKKKGPDWKIRPHLGRPRMPPTSA